MNPTLYEQLCRRYVSDNYKVPLAEIESKTIPNARRPGLPEFGHQIDLRWEISDEFSKVVYIAEVKWRASSKIDKPKVSALAKTCQDVGAQKAVLITSVGFTSGAEAAAQHEGIGLHVVHPNFDVASIPKGTPTELQAALSSAAKPGEMLYTYQVVHRALDAAPRSGPAAQPTPTPALVTREARDYSTRQVTDITTRSGPGPGFTHRSIGGGGPAGPGPSRDGGGFTTRDGGGGFTRGGGGFERR